MAFQFKFKKSSLPTQSDQRSPAQGSEGEQQLVIMTLPSSVTTTNAENVFPMSLVLVFVCIDSLEETPKQKGMNERIQ